MGEKKGAQEGSNREDVFLFPSCVAEDTVTVLGARMKGRTVTDHCKVKGPWSRPELCRGPHAAASATVKREGETRQVWIPTPPSNFIPSVLAGSPNLAPDQLLPPFCYKFVLFFK
mmetsp:Transcript_26011/g.51012  ORF Transcript_26011/g.51012 Transcript_26011/m.51012 type:complete len:115 (+) Transcript_26011:760-1104(+)